MSESSVPKRVRSFDPIIFGVSATLTIVFVLWSALFPESVETVFLLVGASIVLLVTKFSAMKLGKPDDKPEFSSLTWFATLGGLSTTTGLIALQISSGLKYQYGWELPGWGAYLVIGVLTAIFTLAVYTGLEKGIKWTGNVNIWVFVGVWFFVLLLGPTIFLINLTTNSIGQYLIHLLPMSLYTAPGVEGNWLGSWTVLYWAWWMSWSPFVAIFIARISKGRSIRATVAATLILPTLAGFLWYGVIGGAGIQFDVTGALSEHGLESAIFAIAEKLPLTGLLAVVLFFLIATFFLTSANSAAMALSMFVTGKETPGRNMRAFWGIALGAVAAVLAATGSLTVIQTASIATAFPLMFLLLLVLYGTFKGLSTIVKKRVKIWDKARVQAKMKSRIWIRALRLSAQP